jgi:hypothetical protein
MTLSYRIFNVSVLSLLLVGCAPIKDISNPLKNSRSIKNNVLMNTESQDGEEKPVDVELFFFRSADLLTIGQRVELYIDGSQIGVLGHNEEVNSKVKSGGHEITTKVGWSIGLPVTGLGGACKFSEIQDFDQKKHFFKIEFSLGLLCGEHEVLEISELEYETLKK